jgi:hypothetical protein
LQAIRAGLRGTGGGGFSIAAGGRRDKIRLILVPKRMH